MPGPRAIRKSLRDWCQRQSKADNLAAALWPVFSCRRELSLGLGFLTVFGAAGLLGAMLVAWVTNHTRNGFFHLPPW
jgi:uncharacterized membrane protein YphA (DoxX/SURF4 family)